MTGCEGQTTVLSRVVSFVAAFMIVAGVMLMVLAYVTPDLFESTYDDAFGPGFAGLGGFLLVALGPVVYAVNATLAERHRR